jgi:YVTN family beta-propeller protein
MRAIMAMAALVAAAAACNSDANSTQRGGRVTSTSNGLVVAVSRALHGSSRSAGIYAAAGAGHLSPIAARATPMVYVPNSRSKTVSVIDPRTYQVIRTITTGEIPQHVVPSYDFAHLWVLNNQSSTIVSIDPVTGATDKPIHVDDPYNMYFTPDGKYAIVVAERRMRLDFRNPETMELVKSVQTECKGIDHMEFTADNRYLIATCEFNGHLVKVDIDSMKVAGFLDLEPDLSRAMAMPQDIRSSPDGSVFFVADMHEDGVHVIDPVTFTQVGFISTGVGAHGLNPSRDGTLLYVTNRGSHTIAGKPHGPGSISVLDPATRKVIANWPMPGGGSPDMGNVTADGREYWVSGRYDSEVYVFDTATGKLTHRIPVGREPHGLCVWPQPGRFSLGHTGNMR